MGHFEFYPSTARCNIHFVCAQLILKFKGSNVIPGRQQSGWRVDNMDMVDIDMVDMDMVDMDMVDMDMVGMEMVDMDNGHGGNGLGGYGH